MCNSLRYNTKVSLFLKLYNSVFLTESCANARAQVKTGEWLLAEILYEGDN